MKVKASDIGRFLGPQKFFSEVAERTAEPGVATGLAVGSAGGEILFVESTRMRGNKVLTLTGQLGDVMKESANAAVSYVRSHSRQLGIDEDFFKDSDLHIHVPTGATPKDGPSAGVAIVVSLVSLLTGKPVRPDVAMTGEITLRGRVLPVGGIKEKVLAAHRAGIRAVVLPDKNQNDLEDVPDEVRRQMTFCPVATLDEALRYAFDGVGDSKNKSARPVRSKRRASKNAATGRRRTSAGKRKAARR